jgi:hypothetical protein
MSPPHCQFCYKYFSTNAAVRTHIQASQKCQQLWKQYLATFSVHTDDISNTRDSESESDLPFEDNFAMDIDTLDTQMLSSSVSQTTNTLIDPQDPLLRFYESYPSVFNAGKPLLGQQLPTEFEEIKSQREVNGVDLPWAPFASQMEWELAKWLHKNVNHSQIEEFLKLEVVCFMYLFLGIFFIDAIV